MTDINLGVQLFTVLNDTGPDYHVTRETLREAIEDLGFDWWWAVEVKTSDELTDEDAAGDIAFTVGYWSDGERWEVPEGFTDGDVSTHADGYEVTYHTRRVTYHRVAAALLWLSKRQGQADPYQVRAATDYLTDPEYADGDAFTADILTQYAAFNEVLFA